MQPQSTQTSISSGQFQIAKSGNWLGIIAVVCFILAAGFIIKLSIESGWLTPERQVDIAALFGIALVGAGFVLLDYDRKYASHLPAAGIIILYLTAFAVYRFYTIISYQTAIAMTVLVSSLCIWLYVKIKHDLYAIIASIGTYIAPIIFGFSVYLELLPMEIRPWLFVAIGLSYTFLPIKSYLPKNTRSFVIPLMAIFVILGIEYMAMLFHLMGDFRLPWFVVSFASFISIWLLLTLRRDNFAKKRSMVIYYLVLLICLL